MSHQFPSSPYHILFCNFSDLAWLSTTLALLGKFGATGAFAMIYVYTAELYPNALRAVGVGVASATGRVGSILAPFIADLVTIMVHVLLVCYLTSAILLIW